MFLNLLANVFLYSKINIDQLSHIILLLFICIEQFIFQEGVVVKRLLIISVLIFAVLLGVYAEGDELPTIAIMDVAATNTSNVKSQVIYEYIVDVVNKANMYTIVERSALQAAIDEMQIGSSGMVDDTTAAQIGKLAGAEFILISNLIVDDGITYLSTRIVSVESGQVTNTAMLQAGESEYIASLASRTVSELLDIAELVKKPPVSEDKNSPAEESNNTGNVEKEVSGEAPADTEITGASGGSKSTVSIGVNGIIPMLDSSAIFDLGYGLHLDYDYRFIAGSGGLSLGAGLGFFYEDSKDNVLFPFRYVSIPFYLNLKYKIVFGGFYIGAKLGGGGTYNIFTYTAVTPLNVAETLTSLNPAIFPGISVGYMLSDNFGLGLFADWSMTFFTSRPYTSVNAGLAAEINL